MRHINIALKNIVGFIFLAAIGVGSVLILITTIGGFQEFGLKGMALGLGTSVTVLGFALVAMLFLFSLVCPLLEIAENTRVLRDAVQSGSLKVSVTNNPVQSIEEKKRDNRSLDGGLDSLPLRS